MYIQLFDIVELLLHSEVYDVCIHVGITPSILLLATLNIVRPVKADQDDGISPLRVLLLSLRDVSLFKLLQDDGSEPVRLISAKLKDIIHVLATIQVGIVHTVSPVLPPRLSVVNLLKARPVGMIPVN